MIIKKQPRGLDGKPIISEGNPDGYHTKFCVMAHSRKVWKPGLDGV